MSGIKKLSPDIISKIAAGEVIERPLNIVKELVENSIDAGSTKIVITIENGGIDRVRVIDNGVGIEVDEMEMAFQIHTTSKIVDDNISNVSSLGFRGEALASMSSISHISCISRTKNSDQAMKLIFEGGVVISKTQIANPIGTIIEVTGLFYNIPARRKFLKKSSTERKRITELITGLCLNFPAIHFILQEEGKSGKSRIRVESPQRTSLKSVIFDVLGKEISNSLINIDEIVNDWKISGFISKPIFTRSDRSLQFIFVNHRLIRNAELQSAIEEGYGSQLLKSTYPIVVVSISGAFNQVDYNIHPQKMEVRFMDKDPIFEDIKWVVGKNLREQAAIPYLKTSVVKPDQLDSYPKLDDPSGGSHFEIPLDNLFDQETITSASIMGKKSQEKNGSPALNGTKETEIQTLGNYKIIGHIMKKFALIEDQENELWIMDVHASDERVKFEKFENSSQRKPLVQTFLEPFVVRFAEFENRLLVDHKETLDKFGLRISVDGAKLLLHSIPVYYDQELTDQSIKKFLSEIIAYLSDTHEFEDLQFKTPFSRIEYGIVARLACHGSIRSGYTVSNQKIRQVLENLFKCKNPWTCAHGRPTILRIPQSRLESWFKR